MKKGGDMEKLYDKLKEKSSDQAKGRRSLGSVFSVVLLFIDTGFPFPINSAGYHHRDPRTA